MLATVHRIDGSADAGGGADRLAAWLRLAAAPTFAVMALLDGLLAGGPADLLCSAVRHASPLGGMTPMYVAMCAFHLAPWLNLFSARGRCGGAWRA